jgi:hypothetical protein
MEEQTTTEMDSVSENLEEVVTPGTDVVADVDAMSDEEFAKFMDSEVSKEDSESDTEDSKSDTNDNTPDEDLEALYIAQNDSDESLTKPLIIKFKGKTHKLESMNELRELAERGLGATKKYQELSEQRKLFETLEANGYNKEALLQLVTADKGGKLEEVDHSSVEVDGVAQEILNSSYADTFKEVVSDLPSDVTEQMRADANMLKAFAVDVESGLAKAIMPEVSRLIDIRGMDFKEAYIQAAKKHLSNQESVQSKRKVLKAEPTSSSNIQTSNVDIWSMSDAEFDKYFK